ncbi:MAG: UDP-N-acetylmuramoyl-L-alanine--D-glutamate ligase [Candidatus Terrybacteria bacterium]|nr:UDP-N-acetylmuramoyl-L-alanine--D-glutamate ligase [Candidatus Terrybacteria bacterium]
MEINFKNKKITLMGLGILGRGVNVAKFLAEQGAKLTITDLKTKKELTLSLKKLKRFRNIKYVLGKHNFNDFKNKDLIIKAAGVPLDSPYITEARKNKIPVEMDASLFAKLAKDIIFVGVTGTRGKSTVTHLLFEIIKNSKRRVFLGGNIKGMATLPLLKKIRPGDIVVMELDSWQLQGFGDAKISPHIAIFTTFLPDHLNYYKGDMKRYFSDKANIYRFQKKNDWLIMRSAVAKLIKAKSRRIVINKKGTPSSWQIKLLGKNNIENITLAVKVAEKLGIKKDIIKKTVENFTGLRGRLELVKIINGIRYYNDTTATTPDAVINALESLNNYKGKIVLIGGGADKNLDYSLYAKKVKKYVKMLILFKGLATEKILKKLAAVNYESRKIAANVTSMKMAVELAKNFARKGDIVLLSPGAASFGIFKNEFDRGDQFCKIARKI